VQLEAIGLMNTCYEEKFGIPRQPGLCPSAWGRLVFAEKYRSAAALRGLEGFSHVWILFAFHQTQDQGWSPTVRPPRLGGNERVGVFASRSTFRPNGLGLSLCRLEGINFEDPEGPILLLGGVDILDGTPVYDVKPYLSYAEAPTAATSGYANEAPQAKAIEIAPTAEAFFQALPQRSQSIIRESLSFDPRPASHQSVDRIYGVKMCGCEVKFQVDEVVRIIGIS
jgi:tRNA-Thr(GGU) m(6)t(6)A37 methyltransferase TsaA